MSEDTAVLERELYDVKQYASELSGANERNKKEIGDLRKAVAKAAEKDEKIAALEAALANANAEIKALKAGLEKADAKLASADKAVAAGKAISDALGQLASL